MEKALKWNAEFILTDVLDNVLKNLNARDLSRAAQVCKSWNHAVKLEFSRRGPERILIPNPYNPTLHDSEFRVANILRAKPNVVILFCGPAPHSRAILDLEVDILFAYNNRLPDQTLLIVVGVDVAMKDDWEILSCATVPFDNSGMFKILGLALPNYRNIKIDVAYCESHERKSCRLAEVVVKKLMLEISSDQKSILIIFGRSHYSTSKEVLKIIKSTWKSRTYTLWGGTTQNYLKIIHCRSGDFPNYLGMQGLICIRITGQGLEAHTTVISYALKISGIAEKLVEFRNKLKLRRRKLGLVCGSCFSDGVRSDKVMKAIKEVFPDISFTSFFNDSEHYFGLDSTSDDPDQELMHTKSISIMILTYD